MRPTATGEDRFGVANSEASEAGVGRLPPTFAERGSVKAEADVARDSSRADKMAGRGVGPPWEACHCRLKSPAPHLGSFVATGVQALAEST